MSEAWTIIGAVASGEWESPDKHLEHWIVSHSAAATDAYRANPLLVEEHGRQEDSFRTGGYAERQVLELVQNAADALSRGDSRGRVQVILQDNVLYCANEGAPFSEKGLEAICHAYLSDKRDDEIGRFGLGFKSILGVTDNPMVLSRSVSFGFLADENREVLRAIAPSAEKFPVLRLPKLLDAAAEIGGDPVLARLATWATTIVKLPLTRGASQLTENLRRFPAEFLLFASSVEILDVVLPDGTEYQYRCESIGERKWRLSASGADQSEWLVLQQKHRPSKQALEEVGDTIGRSEISVSYAAPLDDSQTLGRFWAYFPLQDVTSARGIHNAPWRISDDRTQLLDGIFNTEILDVLARLVVQALPELRTTADPARHFDYLPARGREAPNFADKLLTELVPLYAAQTECVPDMAGSLRQPDALSYPNADLKLEPESLLLWASIPGVPTAWPHPSSYRTPTRRARLRALVRIDDTRAAACEVSASEWLESGVRDADDNQCQAALIVFMSIKDEIARREMLPAKVIPDSEGLLHSLKAVADLFLHGNPLSREAGLRLVRESFLALPDVEDSLRGLGFVDVDPSQELRRLAGNIGSRWTDEQWESLWALVRQVPEDDASDILIGHVTSGHLLKVKCKDGSWQESDSVIVAGRVTPSDLSMVVDKSAHQDHLLLLERLGVAQAPVVSPACLQDATFLEYLRQQRTQYLDAMPPRGRPDAVTLNFGETTGPGPLHPLRLFGEGHDFESACEWTRLLLDLEIDEAWSLGHSNPKFPSMEVPAPHLWAVNHYGLLETSWGPRAPWGALHPDVEERWQGLLPVATWSVARKAAVVPSIDAMPVDLWSEFLARKPIGGDPWDLGDLVGRALHVLSGDSVPVFLPAVRRDGFDLVKSGELLLAFSDDECRALRERGYPFIAVGREDHAEALVNRWGCRQASAVLRVEIIPEEASEPVILLDRYRRLRDYSGSILDGVELVSCTSLLRIVSLPTGTESTAEDFAVSGRTVYYTDDIDEEDLLSRVASWYGLNLDADVLDRVQGEAETARVRERIAQCRVESDASAKLLTLLPVRTLEAGLPSGLLEAVRLDAGNRGDTQIADLLLLIHGFNVLSELRHQLRAEGYLVPDNWAGSPSAVAFVRHLGFPVEYAGERSRSREADFLVLGPPQLPPLHDYQRELAGQIQDLVRNIDNPGRALLFLPTGAGKTRVTVQALVESIIREQVASPILWIAQSDELCEQAVQTWSTVWREFGDQPLRICRLWRDNEVANSIESHSVVVATDAKLEKVRDRDEYDWLRRASVVVVDEAHTAAGDGMGATLKWLGIGRDKTERPLLGLTATPFKGTGVEANNRFARRFGDRLLNVLGDDPYVELQRLGVLARVEHRVLPGSNFLMNAEELGRFEKFRDVPQSVLERVGRDQERTIRLLEDIVRRPPDWPILVFTSSVLAAQTLSALLKVRGLTSATVSGNTPMAARRRTIEEFRAGSIQVLTNCNVLTQGFDAPGVRALYIAKPTFSPNAYIQMVGRGLRGPLNGGKEECLIVNIEDTFEKFRESLAYKEFDYIWQRQGGSTS